MNDDIDWSLTTWEGSRREQHRRFYALTLREKILELEAMGDVAELFGASVSRVKSSPEPTEPPDR